MAGEYRLAVASLWLAGVGFSIGICYSALGFQGSELWKEESGNFMQGVARSGNGMYLLFMWARMFGYACARARLNLIVPLNMTDQL